MSKTLIWDQRATCNNSVTTSIDAEEPISETSNLCPATAMQEERSHAATTTHDVSELCSNLQCQMQQHGTEKMHTEHPRVQSQNAGMLWQKKETCQTW